MTVAFFLQITIPLAVLKTAKKGRGELQKISSWLRSSHQMSDAVFCSIIVKVVLVMFGVRQARSIILIDRLPLRTCFHSTARRMLALVSQEPLQAFPSEELVALGQRDRRQDTYTNGLQSRPIQAAASRAGIPRASTSIAGVAGA
ncbi:hypothetical protein PpBr36_01421 [Pyricularia pennisetigena]|uniref:hypothetical protein n=1 Tax=Pyricularia pennisetigena TaxID=1578925 RepID=UPI00114EF699|nr:hypothetical protein PpBr36_01421 [Pyricularia pennisetigena]TLS28459.1 hypothetical protein PpBr36_01421 [Pyricularia pennisetigena]